MQSVFLYEFSSAVEKCVSRLKFCFGKMKIVRPYLTGFANRDMLGVYSVILRWRSYAQAHFTISTERQALLCWGNFIRMSM